MESTKQIMKTEAPNSFSFRWGKTGDDVKLYFEDEIDLNNKIDLTLKAVKKIIDFRRSQE